MGPSSVVVSTRLPFVTLLSRRAQSGRWSSFGKRVWFSDSHKGLIISFSTCCFIYSNYSWYKIMDYYIWLKQLDHFQETDTVASLYSYLHHTRTRLNSHWTATVRCPLLTFSHLNLSPRAHHQRSWIYVDRLTYNAWQWTDRNWRQQSW